jgi:hypothetical protein
MAGIETKTPAIRMLVRTRPAYTSKTFPMDLLVDLVAVAATNQRYLERLAFIAKDDSELANVGAKVTLLRSLESLYIRCRRISEQFENLE